MQVVKKRKIVKNLLLLFLITSFLGACSNSKHHHQKNVVQFDWQSTKVNGKNIKHAAIIIPVKIDTLKNTYKMRLDLMSSPNTFFSDTLNNIFQHHPYLKNKVSIKDTANMKRLRAPISMEGRYSGIKILKGYYNSRYPNKEGLIGLIGISQFKNKVLGIDFKNKKIWIQDSLYNDQKSKYAFTRLKLNGNGVRKRVIIELRIGDKTVDAMFLTTGLPIAVQSKKKFDELRNDSSSEPDSVIIANGKLKIYTDKLGKNIYLNDIQLNKKGDEVYLLQSNSETKETETSYLIGNELFFGRKIILDFEDHKFGIRKK